MRLTKGPFGSTATSVERIGEASVSEPHIFYGTFGQAHLGGFGHKYFVMLFTPHEDVAQIIMTKEWGRGWSMIRKDPPEHDERCLGAYYIENEHSYFVRIPT